jgi:hypothetical protein
VILTGLSVEPPVLSGFEEAVPPELFFPQAVTIIANTSVTASETTIPDFFMSVSP